MDQQGIGHLDLPNRNFDTGKPTLPGTYFLADQTYAHLLDYLTKDHFKLISTELRADILAYYSDPSAPVVTKKKAKDWERVKKELEELKSVPSPLPAN